VVAANQDGVQDTDGETPDRTELRNSHAVSVNLAGDSREEAPTGPTAAAQQGHNWLLVPSRPGTERGWWAWLMISEASVRQAAGFRRSDETACTTRTLHRPR